MIHDRGCGPRQPARGTIALIALLLFAVEIYLVTRPVDGLPQTPVKTETFLTDALAKGHRVSQTMKIEAGGFDEILLRASSVGDTHFGKLVLALYEIETVELNGEERFSGEERFLYRDVVPEDVAIGEPAFRFEFPVINESAGRWYRLEIRMANRNVQNDIELWATPGRWSGGGSLFINDLSGFAELVFETRASRRATVWDRLWHHFVGVAAVTLLVLVVFVHLSFFALLYAFMTFPASPTNQIV